MYDSYKLMEHIKRELDKKAETGIKSVSDLETVMKLAQTMKDLAKTEYYCTVTEAMEQEEYSHNDGYSERRRRDSRGRYSREGGGINYEDGSSYRRGFNRDGRYSEYSEAKGDYLEAKHSYRASRSAESRKDMEVSLHECMTKLKHELDEMEANADTREEREKIRAMRREISNIA